MKAPILSVSHRTRRTPFSRRVEECGVIGYTVYNHMLLPTVFRSLEEDYRHLKNHAQLWDVSCQRQVAVRGPDAPRLMQLLTPRDLSTMQIGQCYYTPMVDEYGGMLNDPVVLKRGHDYYWISISDSDLLFWVKGLANGYKLDVQVDEPDVSPLAVQGPKAEDVVAGVLGDVVRDIRFFGFREVAFKGQSLIVARSGYSRQGGFEIYLQDSAFGETLWDALWQAGQSHEIRAGGPNLIERIESGLLSYGNDMTRLNTPYECGLGRFCAGVDATDCVGRDALIRAVMDGPRQMIRGLKIGGARVLPCVYPWPIFAEHKRVGQVTSAAWSPDFQCNVAIGMIEAQWWNPGTAVEVEVSSGRRTAEVAALPLI